MMTISIHTDVVADSPEEACELAMDRMPGTIWESNNGDLVNEEWRTSGELDGTPFDLVAEEIKR
jgi:hypothetical protein